MRRTALILFLSLSSTVTIAAAPAGKSAMAKLVTPDGKAVGEAHFSAATDGVAVHVMASGLTPGVHGIHLHAVGSCKAPDFASAGPHWNPMKKMHGLDSPHGAHLGDIPNLDVKADGTAMLTTVVKGAKLDSSKTGLFDSDGTALVIHAGPDDNKTDPSGNSGGRIACGAVTES